MNVKSIATIAASIAAIATACEVIATRYDIEFHLEPDRPNVSRVWGEEEAIPERVAEAF
jgi:hypothetical protein